MIDNRNLIYKVKFLMEGGDLPTLLNEIRNDIALEIISTQYKEKERREELYMLTKAVDAFTMKLQEYVNKLEQGNE